LPRLPPSPGRRRTAYNSSGWYPISHCKYSEVSRCSHYKYSDLDCGARLRGVVTFARVLRSMSKIRAQNGGMIKATVGRRARYKLMYKHCREPIDARVPVVWINLLIYYFRIIIYLLEHKVIQWICHKSINPMMARDCCVSHNTDLLSRNHNVIIIGRARSFYRYHWLLCFQVPTSIKIKHRFVQHNSHKVDNDILT